MSDDYTPNTMQVLEAYCVQRGSAYHFVVGEDGTMSGAGAEFLRWLSNIMADAWAEGYDKAERINTGLHDAERDNPYRKEPSL